MIDPSPATPYFRLNTALSQWGSLPIATGLKSLDLTWKIFQIVGWYEPDTNWYFLLLWLTEQKQVSRADTTSDQGEDWQSQLKTQPRGSWLPALPWSVENSATLTKEIQKMWAASFGCEKSWLGSIIGGSWVWCQVMGGMRVR